MSDVFIIISMVAGVTLMFWIFFSNRHKERMALIENGADASLFTSKKNSNNKLSSLKWGMLFSGVGIGIFVGNIIDKTTSLTPPVPYFSMILLFGGISLISYYLIERKINTEK